MMEKIGAPQTHIGLKGMIAEIDEDNDGKISFREFLLIYRYKTAFNFVYYILITHRTHHHNCG